MHDVYTIDLERKEALRAALSTAVKSCADVVRAGRDSFTDKRTNDLIRGHACASFYALTSLEQLIVLDVEYSKARLDYIQQHGNKDNNDAATARFDAEYKAHHKMQLQEAERITTQLERLLQAVQSAHIDD